MCDACEISIYIRLAGILICLIGFVISLILEKRNRGNSNTLAHKNKETEISSQK